MPWAWWAKFDTSESIKNWLNVVNKTVEAHCSPCSKNRTKLFPNEPLQQTRQIPKLKSLPLYFFFYLCQTSQSVSLIQFNHFCSWSIYIYISWSHVFSHSHAPSFCLFMSLCFNPERESEEKKKGIFPREVGRVPEKRGKKSHASL